eukprot:TRINITY_DN76796_c0_g1_i1.p1 TRINITY_DN76796_c0_g1~~TRINITY_DN76796_c0_g1_i1.p1  ORF type:complete len:219 (+),score=71.56 TRINITY_DN76796_c0_g1_i1:53-658(+)
MAAPADDEIARVKKALELQMSAPPFCRLDPKYIGRNWQSCEVVGSMAYGKDQKYSGLAKDGLPTGWGILEHHLGIVQVCSDWTEGVANGPGLLLTPETLHYGTWAAGVRVGWFALVKGGGIYLEEYDSEGNVLRRIKWKRDKQHVRCSRCEQPFIPSGNTEDSPMCRHHPDDQDAKGTYQCCGAMAVYNPRGCTLTVHTTA